MSLDFFNLSLGYVNSPEPSFNFNKHIECEITIYRNGNRHIFFARELRNLYCQ